MNFLFDTSVAIGLRDNDRETIGKADALGGRGFISILTRIELEGGIAATALQAAERRTRVDRLLLELPTVAFGTAEADAYRGILAAVGYSRRKLIDRMIAAQALVLGATLVTRNPDDFRDVPGLQLLSW